jgi:hypothetical protein
VFVRLSSMLLRLLIRTTGFSRVTNAPERMQAGLRKRVEFFAGIDLYL